MSDYRELVIDTLTAENAVLEQELAEFVATSEAYREALQATLGLLATVTDERDRAVQSLRQTRRARFITDRAERDATEAA